MGIQNVFNVKAGMASIPKNLIFTVNKQTVDTLTEPLSAPIAEQAPPTKQVEPPAVSNETIVANNNINITRTPITSAETSQENPVILKGGFSEKDKVGEFLPIERFKNAKTSWLKRPYSEMRRDAITNIKVASNNPNFEPTIGKYSAATMNNTERELPSQSSAYLYQQWDLKQEGKTLILKKRDGTEVRIEKKSEVEANYVKELLRPTGVTSYEAKQGDNGNCVTLSQIQHALLTGERIDEIADKIHYNPTTKEVAISLIDNKTFEPKDYIFNQAQIERGRTDRYNNTIASSTTHQDINTFLDLAFRQHAGGNNEELKNNSALDAKNLDAREGVLQKAVDPIKQPIKYYPSDKTGEIVRNRTLLNRFSLEQLAEMQKIAPEAAITLWINRGDKITEKSGVVDLHAYTLVSVDLKTRTALVVNPWDSSKLLKITDATQFFNRAIVENL